MEDHTMFPYGSSGNEWRCPTCGRHVRLDGAQLRVLVPGDSSVVHGNYQPHSTPVQPGEAPQPWRACLERWQAAGVRLDGSVDLRRS